MKYYKFADCQALNVICRHPLMKFAAIGAIGFVIEAAFITYFSKLPDIGPMYGRVISFPLAVLVTWWLNRRVTFKSTAAPGKESARYLSSQAFSAVCNLGLFFILVSVFPDLSRTPIIPLVVSATLGLTINFTLAKTWVFKK